MHSRLCSSCIGYLIYLLTNTLVTGSDCFDSFYNQVTDNQPNERLVAVATCRGGVVYVHISSRPPWLDGPWTKKLALDELAEAGCHSSVKHGTLHGVGGREAGRELFGCCWW